jgi:hypothetical protein
MQKVKVTKRQRKALGRNAMVQGILSSVETRKYDHSDRSYVGRSKGYFGGKGIPFIRLK